MFRIQVFEGEQWREMGRNSTRIDTIEGRRGNIYSEDGRLIATSLPFYEIRMDVNTTGLTDSIFNNNIDSLSKNLANYFQDRSYDEYRQGLMDARASGERYFLIQRKVNYNDLKELKTWPIFNLGQYNGGLIFHQQNRRVNPFSLLARRTVGYARDNSQSVGLEGSFDEYLRGTQVPQSMHRVSGGTWVPIHDDFELEAQNGKDIFTTLDVNLQDVVESVLLKNMKHHWADHGSAIVMEVKTGKIKAIANLGMGTDSTYWEKYNYAIGEKTDPGSTFKAVSLTALLDDGMVTDTTIVDIEGGHKDYHEEVMKDDLWYPYNEITVAKAIEISSNVGVSKLVVEHYGADPQKFIDKLKSMLLDQPTGIEIIGEPRPTIKTPDAEDWSGITLPWMSVGYELDITPLQLLTFFNAIANDGRMMRPYLVSGVKELNSSVEDFEPHFVKQICKKETAQTVKRILQGVIENGTAKKIASENFTIAGKTGTANIAKDRKRKKEYQASFAGFFPAENPIYSCIVVINKPSMGDYYGGSVAGPIFKEIAEKCYSTSTKTHQPLVNTDNRIAGSLPVSKRGYQADMELVYNNLGISHAPNPNTDWVAAKTKDRSIELQTIEMRENLIPNVYGMGLRDAMYVLENRGMKVRFSGKGKVVGQSPRYGQRYYKGTVVNLELR
ncbi:MAG: penicillin-binding protein [Chitinophagales bacterium]